MLHVGTRPTHEALLGSELYSLRNYLIDTIHTNGCTSLKPKWANCIVEPLRRHATPPFATQDDNVVLREAPPLHGPVLQEIHGYRKTPRCRTAPGALRTHSTHLWHDSGPASTLPAHSPFNMSTPSTSLSLQRRHWIRFPLPPIPEIPHSQGPYISLPYPLRYRQRLVGLSSSSHQTTKSASRSKPDFTSASRTAKPLTTTKQPSSTTPVGTRSHYIPAT